MNDIANQNSAAADESDKMHVGLGPKNPTVSTNRRVSLPRDAGESTVSTPNDEGKKRPKNIEPAPVVPASAIWVAKAGGTIALAAAAAISAQTLVSLGHTLGLHGKIAWLLPASLDVYAATSIWVGYRIPADHPAAATARRDARLALTLTVCCNALYHLLLLAGSALPKWLTDALLIVVGALPPLVVERIFHLQMSVRNGDEAVARTVAAPATPTVATPQPRPAATETPVAETTSATPKPQPTATTAATPVATAPVAKPAPQVDGNGTVATLIPKNEQLRIVAELVAAQGPDVPLAEIIAKLGCHKSTASRLRAAVNEESGAVNPPAGEAERKVI